MNKCLCIAICFFFALMSCENENDSALEGAGVKTRVTSCFMSKACLPKVGIYETAGGTEVNWNKSYETFGCNSFKLVCSGAGCYRSEYVGNSGVWFFSHSLTSYEFTYSIYCCDYSCNYCYDSGKFVKKENKPGSMGDSSDCQKEYLSYGLESTNCKGTKLVLYSDLDKVNNTADYMAVDVYGVYLLKNGEEPKSVEGHFIAAGETFSLPSDPTSEYEVRFTSSACAYKKDHYLYFKYSGREMTPDGVRRSLQTVNH